MEDETIKMYLKDAKKLGIDWSDICGVTGGNIYAIREGLLLEDDMVDVPISLLKAL